MGRNNYNHNSLFYYAYSFYGFSETYQGLGILETVGMLELKLLRPGKIPIKCLLIDAFVYFQGQSMAQRIANIYLLDPGQKIETDFGLYGNNLFDDLLLSIFLPTIFIGLGTRWP